MKANLEIRPVIQPNMFREGDKYYIIFVGIKKRHTINVGEKTYKAIEAMLSEVILEKEEEEIKNGVPRETKEKKSKLEIEERLESIIKEETKTLEEEMLIAKQKKT
nr:MAG: hypothetical protein [Microviridae sp.]